MPLYELISINNKNEIVVEHVEYISARPYLSLFPHLSLLYPSFSLSLSLSLSFSLSSVLPAALIAWSVACICINVACIWINVACSPDWLERCLQRCLQPWLAGALPAYVSPLWESQHYLMTVWALSITFYQIFAVEMCMTLTLIFIMDQDQM